MIIINILKIALLSGSFLTSCGQKDVADSDTLVFSKFQKEKRVKFENFYHFKHGTARKFYQTDSSFIVWNARGDDGYFFYQYKFPKMDSVAAYLKMGRGKGETLAPLSGGIYKNTLWIYDMVMKKVIVKDLATSASLSNVNEYHPLGSFFSTQLQDSLKLLVTGARDTTSHKIKQLDLITGKEINRFGSYNDVPDGIPLAAWKQANESQLFINPNSKKVALAYRLTDKVEIFDLNNNKDIKTIKGPENFKAEFTAYKSSDNRDLVQRNDKSRFAFLSGHASEKYIYLLYSGNNHESEHRDNGRYIFVYDWDGKPLLKLTLDRYISSFTVSKDGNTLYGFDVATNYIVKAKIEY